MGFYFQVSLFEFYCRNVFSTVCLSHKVKSENVVRWFGLFVKKKKKKKNTHLNLYLHSKILVGQSDSSCLKLENVSAQKL